MATPAEAVAGEPSALTVVALDAAGNLASTFTGRIHFSSTDLDAVLPDDYSFAPGDAGVATFIVTLHTPGSQQVQASNVAMPLFAGRTTVNVDAPSDAQERAASLADVFFGEADPVSLELPFVLFGRKGHRGMQLSNGRQNV